MSPVRKFEVGDMMVGGDRLTVIAGPCVVESLELCRAVAGAMRDICSRLDVGYVFKASFDKANRTSVASYRGEGMEAGLKVLEQVKREFNVPVTTDIHDASQAVPVAEVVDLLQVPAFLSRQTDLLEAVARTGRAVNVKKGQFLAPWDMKHVVQKLESFGCERIMLTERGVSFGYNTLIVDMAGLPLMRSFGRPVCFDATHSVQLPGGAGQVTGGRRESIPPLARAAAGAGIDAIFMEVHPEPDKGLSDAATMWPLVKTESLLSSVVAIRRSWTE